MAKIQCWEFMKCGHERDSLCPVVEQSAGRRCWLVAGTLNGGKPEGSNARKISNCKECNFYKKIKKGEI